MNNQKIDNDGLILILDVTINDADFILINLYNSHTETERVSLLNNLSSLLGNFDITLEEKLILAGFSLFLSSKLDGKWGKHAIKKQKIFPFFKNLFYNHAENTNQNVNIKIHT